MSVRTAPAWGLVAFVTASMVSVSAFAYEEYDNGSGVGCVSCHGDFRSSPYVSLVDGVSWGDDLHDVHRYGMLDGDCNTCHTSGGRSPVTLNSSNGGSGLAAISCVGCHGRAQDNVPANPSTPTMTGYGAGLRQHHTRAGVGVCAGCHADGNTSMYTPVGEDILPPYYAMPGTGHPSMPTLSCNPAGEEDYAGSTRGLDNDGNDVWDGMDAACMSGGPVGSPCTTPGDCASGFCVDGFCCASACGGSSTSDCRACSNALTGMPNGTCGPVTAGAVCRPSAGICDVAETCNGSSLSCPANAFRGTGFVCRASTGECDVAETCTGGSSSCPANGFQPPGTVCTGGVCNATGMCIVGCVPGAPCTTSNACEDGVISCTSGSPVCVATGPSAAGTICRPTAGACDLAERCNGVAVNCPANSFRPATEVCRAAAGACDVAENCTGSSAACPADAVASTTTICRASSGPCDRPERCDGSSATCGADLFRGAAFVCRAAVGACDVAETCPGGAASCPPDMVAADGAACDDGLACNESEVCTGGTCGGGAATDCDDGDPCTADSCAEPGGCENTPVAGCATDGGLPDGGVDAGDVVDDGGVDEDAGPEPDASTPTDATVPTDASELDASLDAAVTTPADDGGCSCAVPGTGPRTPIGGALLVLAAAALGLRRRRR